MQIKIIVFGINPLNGILDVQSAVNQHHDRSAQTVQRFAVNDGFSRDKFLAVDLYFDEAVVFNIPTDFSNRDPQGIGGFFKGQDF